MKPLIDECLPRTLKRLLEDHECQTVQEMGWSGKKNGVLLSLAELEFDVLVTVDQGIEYEQNLANRKMAVLVLKSDRRFGAHHPGRSCRAPQYPSWARDSGWGKMSP
jgi:hypothetical protein